MIAGAVDGDGDMMVGTDGVAGSPADCPKAAPAISIAMTKAPKCCTAWATERVCIAGVGLKERTLLRHFPIRKDVVENFVRITTIPAGKRPIGF